MANLRSRIALLVEAQGARRAASDVDATARSVDNLGDKAGHTGRQLKGADREARGFNKGLLGLGGALRTGVASLALAAGAGFAAKEGLDFNATMEQNTVAFSNFLGSTGAARAHLEGLYDVAAKTPFEFPDLVNASRRLLAFGQSAEESNEWLATIGDTVAGIGGGTEEINRMVAAIGQIQAKGKASTEEMLQLAELGIPAFDALAKGTGRSVGQVFDDLSKGNISSAEALGALQTQLKSTFGGASVKQAATFTGQLSTLKDNARAALGALTEPLFELLRSKVLPFLNSQLGGVSAWLKGGGFKDFLARIGPGVGKVFGAVAGAAMDLWEAIKPAAPFFQNVLGPLLLGFAGGVLGGLAMAFKAAVFVIKIVATALGWLGQKAAPLRGVFAAIGAVVGFVFGGPILGAIKGLGKLGAVLRAAGWVINIVGNLLGRVLGPSFKLIGWIAKRYIGGVGKTFALLGFAAQVAVGWVRNRFTALVNWFKGMPGRIAGVAKGMFNGITQAFKNAINTIIGAWNGLNFHIGGANLGPLGHLPDINIGTPDIPLLAQGGTVSGRGSWISGEAGPELNSSDGQGNVRVTPLAQAEPITLGDRAVVLHDTIQIDGKAVGTAVRRVALRDLLSAAPA